jgi:hypothetical protein
MQQSSLRNTIATGKFVLLVAILLSAMAWLLTGAESLSNWAGFLVLTATTIVLRLIANGTALIRVRSWYLSSCFIVLNAIFVFQHAFTPGMLAVPLYLTAIYYLWMSYQLVRPEQKIFQAFLYLSLATYFAPKLLWVAVLFFVAMIVQLRALTLRSLLAMLMGLAVGAELMMAWRYLTGQDPYMSDYIRDLTAVTLPDIHNWSTSQLVSIGYVIFFFVIGVLHFSRTNFNDKIRIRMYFYILIVQGFALLALLALSPQDFETVSRLFILLSAPVLAHYFVLGRGRIVDILFVLSLLLGIAVLVFNLWSLSYTFS